jgi:hypothetical protein
MLAYNPEIVELTEDSLSTFSALFAIFASPVQHSLIRVSVYRMIEKLHNPY